MDIAASHRDEPGIGAVEGLELRGAREPGDSVCDHDRRRLRRVVANRLGDHHRRRRGQHEGSDRRLRLQRGASDHDQVQRRSGRDRPGALEPQDFAVCRHASRRQAARDQAHVAAEAVGGAEVDQSPLDRRLAEQHRGGGFRARHLAQLRHDLVVQSREAVDSPAPGDLNLAVGRLELRRRQSERTVLHHEPSAEHRRQHRRACGDAQGDQERPLPARPEARPDEAKREGEASQRHRYSYRTGV